MNIGSRLTTREAAQVLNCKPSEAVKILRLADVPSWRTGPYQGGIILWDAAGVERVAEVFEECRSENTGGSK